MQVSRSLAALALCAALGAAAHENDPQAARPRTLPSVDDVPSAEMMLEVERRRDGTLLGAAHAVEESRRAIAALRAYAATGAERHYRDALRRARHLAALELHATDAAQSASVAWALALAYDWLSPRLAAAEKRALLAPLRTRVAHLVADPAPGSIAALTTIATLLKGEVPESQRWLDQLAEET